MDYGTSNARQAERIFISCAMMDPAVVADEGITSAMLRGTDNRIIFSAIETIIKQGGTPDLVTVTKTLNDSGQLVAAGGPAGIGEAYRLAISAREAPGTAKIIRDNYRDDRVKQIARTLLKRTEAGEADAAMEEARTEMDAILDGGKPDESRADLVNDWYEWIEARSEIGTIPGIASGYKDLDRMTGGFQPGQLIIIAARPAMGKTAFALNLAMEAAINQKQTLFISLEMTRRRIYSRLAARFPGLDAGRLSGGQLTAEEQEALADAGIALSSYPLDISENVCSLIEITKRIRQAVKRGTEMVVIDYLQLIETERKENRTVEVATISRALKNLALNTGIPIIALSQLSRATEARNDKRPMMSDLRESGSIEQDADIVITLYRESYYTQEPGGLTEVSIVKNREGETGRTLLNFVPGKMRFIESCQ